MSHSTSPSLPVIVFSNLDREKHTIEWNSVKSQVWNATEKYGCFQAFTDKVPLEFHDKFLRELDELFDLPLETKSRQFSEKPFHNYTGKSPSAPLYESFNLSIDDHNILENVESFSKVFWPEGNPSFCNVVQSFLEHAAELEKLIRRMILESLEVEKYWDEHMNWSQYLVRLTKYGSPKTVNETNSGLRAHTDNNMITMLYQNQVDGLEIQTRDGEWIKVKFSPGSFLVFFGETFDAYTNGRLYSPFHRVVMAPSEGRSPRYSIGVFSTFREGHTVKAPEELVDEQHPLLYKPFEYFDFLKALETQGGWKNEFPLKDYCGI